MKTLKIDQKNTISVTIRHSTVDEAYIAVELNEPDNEVPTLNKSIYFRANDFPEKTLQSVFDELEEKYKDIAIKFVRSDID
jgi:hypothetical protein